MGLKQQIISLKTPQEARTNESGQRPLVAEFHRLLAELRRCAELGNLNGWRRCHPKLQATLETLPPSNGPRLVHLQLKKLEQQLLGNLKSRAERYAGYFLNESTQALKACNARASIESFKIAQAMRSWSQRLDGQMKGIEREGICL